MKNPTITDAEIATHLLSAERFQDIQNFGKPTQLTSLEDALRSTFINSKIQRRKNWIEKICKSLRAKKVNIGRRMNLDRRNIDAYSRREKRGQLTLKTMERFAEAFDCQFVYGFIPKSAESFSELIVRQYREQAEVQPIVPENSRFKAEILARRIRYLFNG